MKLNKEQLREAVEEGLVKEYIDLERQLTPNGFDLTVSSIESFEEPGRLDFTNEDRKIPETRKLEPENGVWQLGPGSYKVTTNEKVNLPEDIIAFAHPRSSLLRMGCTIDNGVWDAGYSGGSEFLLTVNSSEGVKIDGDARINHMVFEEISETEEYSGRYGS